MAGKGIDGGDGMPVTINSGYIIGAHFDVVDIPQKIRGTRARWRIHPDRSESGTCEDCREYAGQFMSVEEGVGLQPLHPNCQCTLELEPAPGVENDYRGLPPWSLQRRNPELWNRGVERKRAAFSAGGCGHDH